MASCEGSCDGKKGEDLLWFKISEESYDSETKMWPMAIPKTGPTGITRQFTLPTNLKGGEYLLSTTLLSLHGTNRASGQAEPQYYPTAWQIKLDSSGKTDPLPKMWVSYSVTLKESLGADCRHAIRLPGRFPTCIRSCPTTRRRSIFGTTIILLSLIQVCPSTKDPTRSQVTLRAFSRMM